MKLFLFVLFLLELISIKNKRNGSDLFMKRILNFIISGILAKMATGLMVLLAVNSIEWYGMRYSMSYLTGSLPTEILVINIVVFILTWMGISDVLAKIGL